MFGLKAHRSSTPDDLHAQTLIGRFNDTFKVSKVSQRLNLTRVCLFVWEIDSGFSSILPALTSLVL
jgi:hypothetical protein